MPRLSWRVYTRHVSPCTSIRSRSFMKTRWVSVAALFFFSVAAIAQYRTALPGYRYKFPRDHFTHPDFQTEWWYYTGNVKSANWHRFGFELTFFRQGVDRDATKNAAWDLRALYF